MAKWDGENAKLKTRHDYFYFYFKICKKISLQFIGTVSGTEMISLGTLRIKQVMLKNAGKMPEAVANFLRGLQVDKLCIEEKRIEKDYRFTVVCVP